MAKKSTAQIRRLQQRASARGEEYNPPPNHNEERSSINAEKRKAIEKLRDELNSIVNNIELNAKERRTAKRKAEAIACKETGLSTSGLHGELEKFPKKGDPPHDNKIVTPFLTQKEKAIENFRDELNSIMNNAELNAKERRTAKRKAEAIACEESGYIISKVYSELEKLPNKEKESNDNEAVSSNANQKRKAIEKLRGELNSIMNNAELNSKERRAAKRKAEAIASEETGCSTSELQKELEKLRNKEENDGSAEAEGESPKAKKIKTDNPYILFVGQIPYSATKERLYQYLQRALEKKDIKVTEDNFQIRLLTDSKNKNKSTGMAFIQTDSPEIMYECLSLHHTNLDGRRINVEKSAGGKKNSKTRKEKIDSFRKNQKEHMSKAVDHMIAKHIENGDLKENELDQGAVELCKRHSAATVDAALIEYVEARKQKKFANASAYFTHIIGKIATNDGLNSKPSS